MTVCQQFKGGAAAVCRLGGSGQLISGFPEFRSGMKGKVVITTAALFFARRERLRESLQISLVVIDEGHHGWKKKRLNAVISFAREVGAPSVLLTATPPRNMENLAFAAQIKYLDLVPEYLVECEVLRLHTGHEFKPILRNGILSQSSRNEISSRETRYEKIVADSIPLMRGQTIYYAGSVSEAMGVVAEFSKRGVSATVVHSKWATKGERINALAIEQFRRGEVQVLVNVMMLAMGFDVPKVETIIVARPVESDTLFTQMVGRGARPSGGKEKFILIDVHDTIFKPEVAKIFEHKHLFYSDVNSERAKPAPVTAIAPVLMLPVSRYADLKGFPYHEGQLDDRSLVTPISEEAMSPDQIIDVARAAWREG
jgi:superfamily II DNA or RNA helicase